MFMENLPKKGPLFREFWAEKPTHMGGTYPYPQHVMLPPPGVSTYSYNAQFQQITTHLVFLGGWTKYSSTRCYLLFYSSTILIFVQTYATVIFVLVN